MLKKIFPFLLIILFTILLYYPALNTYFSHDDFFHFKVSQAGDKPGGYLYFLGFHPYAERGIAFYRPLFREYLYGPFYTLFGLNHFPFRTLSFTIHFINIYLVYCLLHRLFKSKPIAFIVAFFFAITAANVATLYYLAGGIQTQGATLFILLSLIFFLRHQINKTRYSAWLPFATFIFGISCHEQAAIVPILLAGIVLIQNKTESKLKGIVKLWPYFLITYVYLFLNVKVIGYSSSETQYQMVINLKTTLQTFLWYSVWAIGLPETFVDFLLPGFKLNPNLMKYWGDYYRIIFPVFFVSLSIIIYLTLLLLIKDRGKIFNKRFIFLLFWFPLGILPFLFLPSHKSTHYLYPSLPAFWGILGYLIINAYQKFVRHKNNKIKPLIAILLIALTLLSATSAILGRSTYWAAQRGKLASNLISQVMSKYPRLPKAAIIYIKNDPDYPYISEGWGGSSKQAYFALNGQDALQLLYKDPKLKVIYEDLGNIPPELVGKIVYQIEAKIY